MSNTHNQPTNKAHSNSSGLLNHCQTITQAYVDNHHNDNSVSARKLSDDHINILIFIINAGQFSLNKKSARLQQRKRLRAQEGGNGIDKPWATATKHRWRTCAWNLCRSRINVDMNACASWDCTVKFLAPEEFVMCFRAFEDVCV